MVLRAGAKSFRWSLSSTDKNERLFQDEASCLKLSSELLEFFFYYVQLFLHQTVTHIHYKAPAKDSVVFSISILYQRAAANNSFVNKLACKRISAHLKLQPQAPLKIYISLVLF